MDSPKITRLNNMLHPILAILLLLFVILFLITGVISISKGQKLLLAWFTTICCLVVLIPTLRSLLFLDELRFDEKKRQVMRITGPRRSPKIDKIDFSGIDKLVIKKVSSEHKSGRGGRTGTNSYHLIIKFHGNIPDFETPVGEHRNKAKDYYKNISDMLSIPFSDEY